jgi:hypothetical protein
METLSRKVKTLCFIFLLISGICLLFYSNALNSPFIWDDDGLIVKNFLIRSFKYTFKAFSTDLYTAVASGSNF